LSIPWNKPARVPFLTFPSGDDAPGAERFVFRYIGLSSDQRADSKKAISSSCEEMALHSFEKSADDV
jgi:hypothetical protein